MLIGVHGRNDFYYTEADYRAIEKSGVQLIKTMSQTNPEVYKKLREINPDIQFIVRLYNSNFGVDHHPNPQDFVNKAIMDIISIKEYTNMWEIANEPNHIARYEGWGQTDEDALNFRNWYKDVLRLLRKEFPDMKFGFPGLAVPHRDLEWLEICRPIIEESDFLSNHCYWQNPTGIEQNHLNDFWGLRVKHYIEKFPDMPIHIVEAGNSNGQNNYPLSETQMANELLEWYDAVSELDNVHSASPFILSSPDPYWDQCGFTWITKDGRFKEIIYRLESYDKSNS